MITKNTTSRLYYGKYAYRILLRRSVKTINPNQITGWTPQICRKWLKASTIDHRIYTQYSSRQIIGPSYKQKNYVVLMTCSIFVRTKDEFDQCVAEWGSLITSITEPHDINHINVLKDNTEIVIRKTLVYNLFRYVVLFHHMSDDLESLESWVKSTFLDRINSDASVRWKYNKYRSRLYLTDDDDLTLTKLSWSDNIHLVTVIRTHAEIEQAANSGP